MAYLTFADQLTEARRRARLSGRTLSQQESAGITEGSARAAGDKALQEYGIRAQERQFGEQLATQKEQFGKTIETQKELADKEFGFKERELATQKEQFGVTSGLEREKLAAQIDQFGKTYGLKERELEQLRQQFGVTTGLERERLATQKDQFGKTLGFEREKAKTQKEQFGETLATQKEQFTKELVLKNRALDVQIQTSQQQLEMARMELEERRRQFEESSRTQKEQFGEQMKLQILESQRKVDEFEKKLDFDKYSLSQNLQLLRDQMNAQLDAARRAEDGESSGGCCIIVTVCSNPTMKYVEGKGRDCYAVNVTRKYRDTLMPAAQLRGYYMIAEFLVPRMYRSEKVMEWAKVNIVDNVVPYCEWRTGLTGERPPLKTIIKAKAFLWLCSLVGSTRASFTRCNGEVF